MKNIRILPTDKPTGIFKSGDNLLFSIINKVRTIHEGFHIYITNDEDIKEGDWCLDIKRNIIFQSKRSEIGTSKKIPIIICTYEGCYIQKDCKKIILTTDGDLIKDGVQSIDDEFLEWFVKNQSCEEVEVDKEQYHQFVGMKKIPLIPTYKIIIPKEEPKKNFYCGDEVDYDDKCLEQCDRCVDATGVDYGYLPEEHVELINKNIDEFDKKIKEQKQHLIDMMKQDEELGMYEEIQPEQNLKQETLEEAAERLTYTDMLSWENALSKASFINGAKWQQERIHNDEDIESIIAETWIQCVKNDGNNFKAARDGIIKQFKKE